MITGCDSEMIHAMLDSKMMRMHEREQQPDAARGRAAGTGSLLAASDRKMMLSMPSTISSTVSVSERDPGVGRRKKVEHRVRSEPGQGEVRERN